MSTVRLAVLSDIHGNLPALEATLADVGRQGADLIVNLGDCVTGPLWPRESLELLHSLNLPTVRGNHDRWIAERPRDTLTGSMRFTRDALTDRQRRSLGDLPPVLEVTDDVLAVHGTPDDDCEYLLEESLDGRLCLRTNQAIAERLPGRRHGLVLCGHSHQQHAGWATNMSLVVNPGSVGGPRYADNSEPASNEAGSPHARYAMATSRAGRWGLEFRILDYDWDLAVARARAVGRSDWVAGFLKGGGA